MLNHTHSGLGLPPINIGVPEVPEADGLNPFSKLFPSISSTALLAGAGLAAYLLLGRKK